MRRAPAEVKQVEPDPIYRSVLVSQVINKVLWKGKKNGSRAIVYGALGLLAAFAGAFFGALNASPWFNVAIAAIFTVMGLAMFDVLLIDFTKYQTKFSVMQSKRGGMAVALGMGSVTALLAGACVGPVVIAVIILSQDLYAKGSIVGLMLPLLLGVGMALPWPFAGAGLSFLPKPGMWMVRVKQVFGVFIFAMVAYYGYTAYDLFAARMVDPDDVLASATEDSDGWLHSLSAGLEQGKAEGKPVFLDFWATWCKNCLVMNKTTFKNAEVQQHLEGYIKVKYQAEFPNESPTQEIMNHFEVRGLPTYLVLEPPSAS